jgi:hypothetical protein
MLLVVALLELGAGSSAAQVASSSTDRPAVIVGTVSDDTAAVLPGAVVTARNASGRIVSTAHADDQGGYRLDGLVAGTHTVEVAFPNFATRRFTGVSLAPGETRTLDATLALTIAADVTVTAKRTFRNLAELQSADGGLLGAADTASEGLVTGRQIDARPIMRAGEILEAVPGLVISQHSGEGKANQYYLRGFNLDHGTDFATSIAGLPVNMPTHAHGQGYSDVNFLIPELVAAVQFQKGVYSAEQGDFSTAGASHVRYVDSLERPLARVSVGEDGWRRLFAGASPRVGGGRMLVALESARNDGPWVRPDRYGKFNAVVGFSRGDVRNGFSIKAMGYRATWDATDQAPARATESGVLQRFSGVDDTTGGDTARYSVSADWQRTRSGGVTRANAYALRYRLNLFSNFTYFLDDPVNGDQFEQADRRWVTGGRVTHRRLSTIRGRPAELVVGVDTRHDAIGEVGLHHTAARRRLDTIRQDAVNESSVGLFAQQELQWTPWMRTSLGLRGDRYWFDVDAGNALNSGTTSAGVVNPKASLIVGPWRNTEMFVSAGTGFHSNDARGTTITVDPLTGEPVDSVTPLVRARGAEVGVRAVPRPGLQMTAAVWTLSLESELLFVGDAGTTDTGRPSRRYGVELTSFYSPVSWLTLDGDVALSRARFRDDDPVGLRIPGSLERVIAAGITVGERGRFSGSLRLRHFGPRDLIEDGSVRSRGTTLVNGQLVFQASRRARVVLDAFNVLDAKVSDIDYYYTSRLRGEPSGGVDDIHTHPALPRSMRLGFQIGF